jgi:hypothetical protein
MEMKFFKKIRSNYSYDAIKILGLINYLRFIYNTLINIFDIIKTKNLNAVDRAMGLIKKPLKLCYQDKNFVFDCKFCDEKYTDDNYYSFGYIRELYIRDSYFKFHDDKALDKINTMLDLGANRGTFSVFMASCTDKVICVEIQKKLIEVIEHNMRINNFTNYNIENTFVGGEGYYSDLKESSLSIQEILLKNGLDSVDFIKMDIEGSEFALFEKPEWLKLTKYLSMELHPKYGDVNAIAEILKEYKFEFKIVNEQFIKMREFKGSNIYPLLFAWKKKN